MFNVPDEIIKCDEFIKELKVFCEDHGYSLEYKVPYIYFSSPEGSIVKFDATLKHKLHNNSENISISNTNE